MDGSRCPNDCCCTQEHEHALYVQLSHTVSQLCAAELTRQAHGLHDERSASSVYDTLPHRERRGDVVLCMSESIVYRQALTGAGALSLE